MLMYDLAGVIELLKTRIAAHGGILRENETRTRMALIDPLLKTLGWDTSDPAHVLPEYDVNGRKADYALLKDGNPLVLVEAKKLGESLTSHRLQMLNYANVSGISYAGLIDGDNWEVYDVFQRRPLEDKRIIEVSIMGAPVSQCAWMLSLLPQASSVSEQAMSANQPVLIQEHPVDKALGPQRLLDEVAGYYGMEPGDLVSRNRKQSVSWPRQVAMYLLTRELNLTPTHVGRMLGGRDHANVIHGTNKVNSRMSDDAVLRGDILAIVERAGLWAGTAK